MSETVAINVTPDEALFWAGKVAKDRAEVAQWKNERTRRAVLVQLDSLLAKLRTAGGEVSNA